MDCVLRMCLKAHIRNGSRWMPAASVPASAASTQHRCFFHNRGTEYVGGARLGISAQLHTHARARARTHTHSYTHTRTCACTSAHTHTHTYTHTHTCARVRMYKRTHTHTHTHTRTHTHRRRRPAIPWGCPPHHQWSYRSDHSRGRGCERCPRGGPVFVRRAGIEAAPAQVGRGGNFFCAQHSGCPDRTL
jgi:hypothetical protein